MVSVRKQAALMHQSRNFKPSCHACSEPMRIPASCPSCSCLRMMCPCLRLERLISKRIMGPKQGSCMALAWQQHLMSLFMSFLPGIAASRSPAQVEPTRGPFHALLSASTPTELDKASHTPKDVSDMRAAWCRQGSAPKLCCSPSPPRMPCPLLATLAWVSSPCLLFLLAFALPRVLWPNHGSFASSDLSKLSRMERLPDTCFAAKFGPNLLDAAC